jgi:hypothetical protein
MGIEKRIESFIQRTIWKLTRSSDIIKYVPKRLHNGVVIGDCAVIRKKGVGSIDIFSKQRQAIVRDLHNHKIAICIATLMNQYTPRHAQTIKEMKKLDKEYHMLFIEHNRLSGKKKSDKDVLEYLEDRLQLVRNKIDSFYSTMTI